MSTSSSTLQNITPIFRSTSMVPKIDVMLIPLRTIVSSVATFIIISRFFIFQTPKMFEIKLTTYMKTTYNEPVPFLIFPTKFISKATPVV